jgi:hypothetical protein
MLQVESEVRMMMGMDHPNLCRAYHYVTWGAAGQSESLHLVSIGTQWSIVHQHKTSIQK